jgi:type II secretory pathway pseudopilin PulG
VELLVVVSIILVMMGLMVPAFNAIKGGGDVTKAAYDIAGILEQARTYAMANNTYVWVGFFEEDGSRLSQTPAASGVGRLVISAVASKDGTRYRDVTPSSSTPAAFGSADPSNPVSLVTLNKLVKVENTHLAALNDNVPPGSSNSPPRPPVKPAYQVGDTMFEKFNTNATQTVASPTTFAYPLTGTAQYTFKKIIEFNQQGEATKIVDSIVMGPQEWIELAIQPTRGSAVDGKYAGTNKAAAAIQVEGLTGRVRFFRL